jgi:hypothetical protein
MKKNVMMRVASALLVAVLMTTCAISGTFAKYTTTAVGSDSARVAKWAFELNDATMGNTFTFDLAETWTDYDGTAEVNVADKLLAPGTKGSFVIKLENLSEVDAKYSLKLEETFKNLPDAFDTTKFPVEYSLNGTDWNADISQVKIDDTDIAMSTGSATITVYWRWAFLETDAANAIDTALGAKGNVEVTVTATITVNQVN